MRASIAVSASDRAAPFSSAPSSAGLLGSLDLHALRSRTSGGDVEEDQRQRHTASQRSVSTFGRHARTALASPSGYFSALFRLRCLENAKRTRDGFPPHA